MPSKSYMHLKAIIKLLAEKPGITIYRMARKLGIGDSSAYYALKRLKKHGVVNANNELTELGRRLYRLIRHVEHRDEYEEDCEVFYGSDTVEVGLKLGIFVRRRNLLMISKIRDPEPVEHLKIQLESAKNMAGLMAFELTRRVTGFLFDPSRILLSQIAFKEKKQLLWNWYNEYYPEVHALLALLPLFALVGVAIASGENKQM